MKLKDVNFKELVLQKGERIGLAVAGVITALLVVGFGAASVMTDGPQKNVDTLKDLQQKAKTAHDTSKPPENLDKLPPELEVVEVKPVRPDEFPCFMPYFLSFEEARDRKWRLPVVLKADEFQVELVRGSVEAWMLRVDKDGHVSGVGILRNKTVAKDTAEAKKKMEEFQKAIQAQDPKKKKKRSPTQILQQQQVPGAANPLAPQAPGLPQPPAVGRGRRGPGGGERPGALPAHYAGMQPGSLGAAGAAEQEVKFVSEDKLTDEKGKPAETNLPVRMVVVTGAFPFKAQLEEFAKALRFESVDELLLDPDFRPEFTGFTVERRTLGPDGKPLADQDWAPLDVDAEMKPILMRSVGLEPEKDEWRSYGIIVSPNRLVMPRPRLARGKYSEPELAAIKETETNLAKALETSSPIPQDEKKSRFDIDFYNSDQGATRQGAMEGLNLAPRGERESAVPAVRPRGKSLPGGGMPRIGSDVINPTGGERRSRGQGAVPAAPGLDQNRQPLAVPDQCLIRFIDPTVKPGTSYEYRVAVRMSNPNAEHPERAVSVNITKQKEITGEPQLVTWKEGDRTVSKVSVPDELLYYVIEDKKPAPKDRAIVQVHRWLAETRTKPNQKGTEVPVGDWTILEHRPVARGEYVGGYAEVEVPIWQTALERFGFAIHPDEQTRSKTQGVRVRKFKGIPVDFATDPVFNDRALVVDFEGGERTIPAQQAGKNPQKYQGPVEILVLTADGRLIVHNSRADTDDKERKERFTAWKAWLEQIRNQGDEAGDKSNQLFTPGAKPGKGADGSNRGQ